MWYNKVNKEDNEWGNGQVAVTVLEMLRSIVGPEGLKFASSFWVSSEKIELGSTKH